MKMSAKKTEVLCLSRNSAQCTRQYTAVSTDVELLMSDGWITRGIHVWRKAKKEFDARAVKANAVLREIYRSVVTKL